MNLFDNIQEIGDKTKAQHYFVSIDSKVKDFIIFNAEVFDLTNEEILPDDLIQLRYKKLTPIIAKLKSEAWSCGCRWFFVMQDEGIYLMNTYDEHFFLCKKHSNKFIEMYLDASILGKFIKLK